MSCLNHEFANAINEIQEGKPILVDLIAQDRRNAAIQIAAAEITHHGRFDAEQVVKQVDELFKALEE